MVDRAWVTVQDDARLPLLTVRGARPGPVLGLTGAIHGDEFEGPAAILRFIENIDASQLCGTVLAIPVANPPACRAISRTSPIDGANLARVFPGCDHGTLSERIAAAIVYEVIAKADFFIDLHTGGVRYAMPTMAGYYTKDARSLEAARAFGAPVIWGHDVIPPGRTLSCCLERGIPFLYTEGRGAGRLDPFDLHIFEQGLWNVARHLQMLPGEPHGERSPLHLLGDGNVDRGAASAHDGFFFPRVRLLDRVVPGALMGQLSGYDGCLLAEYRAERAGVVAMLRVSPSVTAGEPLYLLADAASS